MKIINILTYPIKLICYAIIYFYRLILRPLFPTKCGYSPSCSEYMIQAINEWGVFRGGMLGIKRIIRCNPRHVCGYDPVPINPKGEHKWVF